MAKHVNEKSNIEGDRVNICLLLLMYSFQGVVYGFTLALPIIFQNRKISYADQVSLTRSLIALHVEFNALIRCLGFNFRRNSASLAIPSALNLFGLLSLTAYSPNEWVDEKRG